MITIKQIKAAKVMADKMGTMGTRSREQIQWKLSEPITYDDTTSQYVLSSASLFPPFVNETFIFFTDENGTVIDWGELPGSIQGQDHNEAINGLLEYLNKRAKKAVEE